MRVPRIRPKRMLPGGAKNSEFVVVEPKSDTLKGSYILAKTKSADVKKRRQKEEKERKTEESLVS